MPTTGEGQGKNSSTPTKQSFPGGSAGRKICLQCRRPLAAQEMLAQSLGLEDSLEKEMATDSSILVWRISETENLVGYSTWGHKESD